MNLLHLIKTGIFCLLAAATFSLPSAQAAEAPTPTPKEIAELRSKAEKGDADAQFSLGDSYSYGRGVPKDNAEAVKWYHKAAEQEHAEAQLRLGISYYSGRGSVPKNEAEAVKWFRKAAEQGNGTAQLSLAISYFEGRGVPKDLVETYKWFLLIGAQAHERSQAKKAIEALEEILTGEQRAEGQRLAREWKPSKPNSEVKPGTK